MTPGIAKQVTEVTVDEQGIYRLQGKTKTDHNTTIIEINLNIKPDIKKVKMEPQQQGRMDQIQY